MEFVLTTHDLTKKYRHSAALDGLSMNVPKGSIYGFVGRNGAGKTTLIRMICGLQFPTSGEFVLYGEHSGGNVSKARRRLGAVVETPSIHLDMSAVDNLKEQYRVLGLPSFDGIPELLRLVGLENTGKKRARHFSLGMRQRLGIAIALCGDPDFLLLDEPVNGLDPQGIVEVRELLIRLNRERQITILISSHILDELSRLATHYGFIDKGRIVRELSAEQFERECRKCARVKVSDVQKLAMALDKLGSEYAIIDSHCADVYGEISITKLAEALSGSGCELFSVNEHDESLEAYFINLIGGASHD